MILLCSIFRGLYSSTKNSYSEGILSHEIYLKEWTIQEKEKLKLEVENAFAVELEKYCSADNWRSRLGSTTLHCYVQ